ncbi:hypothetical protein HPB51_015845 [Rhipicephalus microplus]|uniref:TRUD domain-containing protein n=1 Tax=Rhipicephalus microplus TaxID=6941 RepID=A0A9J6DHU3_RHIMP|nr:hypothetical protein HPB51_015845 [Rhipicephalus microplus]
MAEADDSEQVLPSATPLVRLETLEPPPEPKPDTSWADDNVSTEAKEHLELLADGQRTEPVVIPVAGLSKEQRGQVHVWIRAHWPHLESHTATDSTVRVSRSKVQRRRAAPWPSGRPSYTTFVLYKENMDTIEAVNRIATFLGMRPSCLGYAGTKDKRAKTCQRVSCHRLPAKKLLSLNRRQGLWVGNITFENAAIKLGDLQGNRFTIVLRDIDGTKADHEEAMKSLSKNGFLNYYGTQRFGTTSVATHQIGRALLKGCYEEAVDLVLQPRDGVADWYKEILAEDGLTLNSFSEQKHRDLSMSGCYRHLVAVPRDVQWQEVSYTDPQAALVLSDLDKLQGLPEPPSCESDENARRALKLEFNLSSSCYATMAVRELLHRECTSWTPIATS